MVNLNLSDLRLDDLSLYVTVVESASITLAAEHLGTSTSTLSRRLQKLEKCLGARLLERTTRRIHITESGELFYKHCQQVLSQFEKFSEEVGGSQESLSGRISVYAPAELFRYWIKELVVEFRREYPNLRVEFVSGGAKPHLLKDNLDILVHIDAPEDSSFIARNLNGVRVGYYASPSYLKRRGTPQHPDELIGHDCIIENDQDRVARPWIFKFGDTVKKIKVEERFSSDSAELCRALAEQGQGITMLPNFIARESLANGSLVQLFQDYTGSSRRVYVMYASRKYIPRKIRAFVDFIVNRIPEDIV